MWVVWVLTELRDETEGGEREKEAHDQMIAEGKEEQFTGTRVQGSTL